MSGEYLRIAEGVSMRASRMAASWKLSKGEPRPFRDHRRCRSETHFLSRTAAATGGSQPLKVSFASLDPNCSYAGAEGSAWLPGIHQWLKTHSESYGSITASIFIGSTWRKRDALFSSPSP